MSRKRDVPSTPRDSPASSAGGSLLRQVARAVGSAKRPSSRSESKNDLNMSLGSAAAGRTPSSAWKKQRFAPLGSSSAAPAPRDPVQVCLRIRPFSDAEKAGGARECLFPEVDEEDGFDRDMEVVDVEDGEDDDVENDGAMDTNGGAKGKGKGGAANSNSNGNGNQTRVAPAPTSVVAIAPGSDGGPTVTESRYAFSRVFDQQATQEDVFEVTGRELVDALFEGRNGLLFAYGITGSGKTYTIQGTPENRGVMPRALESVFARIAELEGGINNNSNNSNNKGNGEGEQGQDEQEQVRQPQPTRTVTVSYLEVYNDNVYDLLLVEPEGPNTPRPTFSTTGKRADGPRRKPLRLHEDADGKVVVKGLSEVPVASVAEGERLLARGARNRAVAATNINEHSSRSHAVFQIGLTETWPAELYANTALPGASRARYLNGGDYVRTSTLYLVDLAGSERQSRTQSTGLRLKEASSINSSLMTLGRCMEALRYNSLHRDSKPRVVPFRNSRMTRIFQGPLQDGRAFMIVNVDAGGANYDETSSCLRYAAVARDISTVARVNRATAPQQQEAMGVMMLPLDEDLNNNNNNNNNGGDLNCDNDANSDDGSSCDESDGECRDPNCDGGGCEKCGDMTYAQLAQELALTQARLLSTASEKADLEMSLRAEASMALREANARIEEMEEAHGAEIDKANKNAFEMKVKASLAEKKAEEDKAMYSKLIDDLSGQIASLEREGQEVRERWAQAVAEAGRREAERGGVEKERDESVREAEKLRSEVSRLEHKVRLVEGDLTAAVISADGAHRALAEASKSGDLAKTLADRCASLETEISALGSRNADLEAKNSSLIEEGKGLVSQNSNLIKENQGLVSKNEGLIRENESLMSKNSSLTKENESLVSQNSSLTKENQGLMSQNSNLIKENEGLVSKNSSLAKENAVLADRNGSLEALATGTAALAGRVAEAETRLTEQQRTIATQERTIRDMHSESHSTVSVAPSNSSVLHNQSVASHGSRRGGGQGFSMAIQTGTSRTPTGYAPTDLNASVMNNSQGSFFFDPNTSQGHVNAANTSVSSRFVPDHTIPKNSHQGSQGSQGSQRTIGDSGGSANAGNESGDGFARTFRKIFRHSPVRREGSISPRQQQQQQQQRKVFQPPPELNSSNSSATVNHPGMMATRSGRVLRPRH